MKQYFFPYLIVLLLLAGCSRVGVEQYADNTPVFDIYSYFEGTTKGWGMVQNRKGELLRQFVVDIQGRVDEQGNLILREDFYWNDGEKTQRVWTIARQGDDRFQGSAADVVGEAHGEAAGNALNWQYDLEIEVDGSTWVVHFDDWMFLQPDGILLNRATMKKFGFKVGEVTIAFRRLLET